MRYSLAGVLVFSLVGIFAAARWTYGALVSWPGDPLAAWIAAAVGLVLAGWAITAIANAIAGRSDPGLP